MAIVGNEGEQAGGEDVQADGAPGNAELVTYFADLYEDELDYEAMAAEFDLTPTDFEDAAKRISDPALLRVVIDWMATLESGGTIPRVELEDQYAFLLDPMMGLKSLPKAEATQTVATTTTTATTDTAATTATATSAAVEAAIPEYRKEEKEQESKVKLALHVPSTTAKVGEKLSFELSTNQACELQVLYVEEGGNVEIIPDVMIGNTTLNPDEKRQIPQPGTGNLTFDTPAAAETMVAFCRVGGLGDQKLTAEKAKKLVADSHQPTTRGIAINLAEQAKADNGASGLQMVTFEIKAN